MTCPKCNVEMIEGRLWSDGQAWSSIVTKVVKFLKFISPKYVVSAFRCPQCNKIELVAAEIK